MRTVTLAIAAAVGLALANPPSGISWIQTFRDDFTGTTLDTTKWHPHDHFCGTRNNELQAYVPENATVSGGLCRLVAERRQVNYGYCGQAGIVKQYAAGIIISADKFDQQYGYWEIRCQSPAGQGLWPAFWMLPYDKWPPEIDVLEILGHEPDRVYLTNHWGTSTDHQANGTSYKGPDFSAGMHDFAVLWRPDSILWYVDGVVRHRSGGGVPHEPFYILANLAVGGNWPGAPDSNTVFPSSFDIEHIAVWQYPDSVLARFNHPPSCTISSPANGALFQAPASITVTAAVADDHRVVRVAFLNGTDTIGTRTGAPWSVDLDDVGAGLYTFRAVAWDDSGMSAVSPVSGVRVLDSTGNLITNGEFNSGTTGWSAYQGSGAAGAMAVVTNASLSGPNALRVTMTTPGTADWHYQVTQTVPLVAGDTLEIWFTARAAANKNIRLLFQEGGGDYTEYWSRAVSVGTSAATYGPYTWVVNVTDPNAGFKFLVGADTVDIWLDDVRVIRHPAGSAVWAQGAHPPVGASEALSMVRVFDLAGRRVLPMRSERSGVFVHLQRRLPRPVVRVEVR